MKVADGWVDANVSCPYTCAIVEIETVEGIRELAKYGMGCGNSHPMLQQAWFHGEGYNYILLQKVKRWRPLDWATNKPAVASYISKRITKETENESYEAIEPKAGKRRKEIISILKECGEMTAQEVARAMYERGFTPSDERNYAAPRLTELQRKGVVNAVGKKKCYKTGKTVAVWKIVNA